MRAVVVELLGKRWSPEQVAHELPTRFPDQPARHLCPESIYQGIYDTAVEVTRPAKRRRRRRRRRVQGLERRGRLINMTMIADRPAEVEDRVQVGHWEGDCIMGRGNRSAIGTLVERSTRFLILVHIPADASRAEAIRDGVTDAFTGLPPNLRRTLTWDQGKELAHPRADHRRHRRPRVLLRRALTLAARHRREHERATAGLLPQRHRPEPDHRRAASPRRRGDQRPATQDPRVGTPSRSAQHPVRGRGSLTRSAPEDRRRSRSTSANNSSTVADGATKS